MIMDMTLELNNNSGLVIARYCSIWFKRMVPKGLPAIAQDFSPGNWYREDA